MAGVLPLERSSPTRQNRIFLIGAEASFIFGTVVKEDSMLNYLLNSNGNIVDVNGFAGDVVLDQRAFDLQLSFSKYILEVGPNPNCGFYAGLGIGYLQHTRFESVIWRIRFPCFKVIM